MFKRGRDWRRLGSGESNFRILDESTGSDFTDEEAPKSPHQDREEVHVRIRADMSGDVESSGMGQCPERRSGGGSN